jgi:hypothetical protein
MVTRALLRLALETRFTLEEDIAAVEALFEHGPEPVRMRAAVVYVRWTDAARYEAPDSPPAVAHAAPRMRALAFLRQRLREALPDLARIGVAAVPLRDDLVGIAERANPRERSAALAVIADMGTEARPAIPALERMVRQARSDEAVRALAAAGAEVPSVRGHLMSIAARDGSGLRQIVDGFITARVPFTQAERDQLRRIYDRRCEAPVAAHERTSDLAALEGWPAPMGCDVASTRLRELGVLL